MSVTEVYPTEKSPLWECVLGLIEADLSRCATPTSYTAGNRPTSPRVRGDFAPAYSPDGKQIAFTTLRDGAGTSEIYRMNALDGSRQQNRTNNGATDWVPDWGVRVR